MVALFKTIHAEELWFACIHTNLCVGFRCRFLASFRWNASSVCFGAATMQDVVVRAGRGVALFALPTLLLQWRRSKSKSTMEWARFVLRDCVYHGKTVAVFAAVTCLVSRVLQARTRYHRIKKSLIAPPDQYEKENGQGERSKRWRNAVACFIGALITFGSSRIDENLQWRHSLIVLHSLWTRAARACLTRYLFGYGKSASLTSAGKNHVSSDSVTTTSTPPSSPSATSPSAMSTSTLTAASSETTTPPSSSPPPAIPSRYSMVLMCWSAAQILSTWIAEPHLLNPTYMRFLNKHGGKSGPVLEAMTNWSAHARPFDATPSTTVRRACAVIHRDDMSCKRHAVSFFFNGSIQRSWNLYIWLHGALFVLGTGRKLLALAASGRRQAASEADNDEEDGRGGASSGSSSSSTTVSSTTQQLQEACKIVFVGFTRLIENMVRSTLFLSTYCTLAWMSACFAYRYCFDRVTRASFFSHTWIAGLSLVFEKPSRRADLAFYCCAYAFDSIHRTLIHWKWIPARTPRANTLLMSLAMATLAFHADQQSPLLSYWLLGLEKV